MGDETTGFSLPDAGQGTDSNQAVPEAKETPQYITRTDLEEYFSQFGNRIEKKLSEFSQSVSDKTQDRVKKALDDKMTKLDAFFRDRGVAPEEQAAIRQQVRAETLKEEALRSVSQEPEPAARQPDEAKAVNQRVSAYLQEMGVQFQKGDKELEMIVTNGTADQYERSVIKAAAAWLKRQGASSEEKANPEARIPGLVGGAGQVDRASQINEELGKLYANPGRNIQKIAALTKELQSIVRK